MLISAIKQTSPGRLSIEFAEGESIKSTLGVVTELRLYSGRELDGQELEELKKLSLRSIARDKALELVSRRRMSCKELREKLIRKGEDEDTAEYCVRWLSDNGFMDDAGYAEAVARHYSAKGYGAGRVRAELQRRGIDRELWDDTIEKMPENDDKLDRFIASRLTDPGDRDQIRKISSALYRRGYSWEQIRSALGRFEAQIEEY